MKLRLGVVLALLPACKTGGDYHAPERELTAAWSESSAAIVAEEPVREWWTTFQDPALDSLVTRALAQSLDLELARARVREARALRDVAAGGDDPTVVGGAGYERSRNSENDAQSRGPRENDLWRVGFDATWELDLFGRNAAAVAAAEAGLDASIEAQHDATVVLLAELALDYVTLRGTQRELEVARSNLATQRDTYELTRGRFQAGFVSELDVARAESQVSTTESQIPALESSARASLHRIAILLALDPGALVDELSLTGPVPSAPAAIAAGLPADLLRRRPDVRRAERELAREFALSAEARAELYPRVSLAASWGQRSTEASNLFDSGSNAWSIGPSLVMPIFEAGILKANVRAQAAREQQALLGWQKSVLQAQAEVEDAIAALTRERERNLSLESALRAQSRAVELARDLFTRGLVDFFEVLDAQRAQFVIETELARSTTKVSTDAVALFKALGGGWDVVPDEPREEPPDKSASSAAE